MSTFGDDLIRSLEEAVAHARGNGPAVVHASVTPREVRKQANLTQAQMAPSTGMSLSGYRKWEQGTRRMSGPAETMRKALVVVLAAMACSAVSSAQSLEVHLTHAEPGDPLRAGALYTATPINGWLYIDLALAPLISGDIRPHRDIYLVGHEGTRFPLPDLRTYRANRETIREVFGAIAVSESAGCSPSRGTFRSGATKGGPCFAGDTPCGDSPRGQ